MCEDQLLTWNLSVHRRIDAIRRIGLSLLLCLQGSLAIAQDFVPSAPGNGLTPFGQAPAVPSFRDPSYGIVPGPPTRPTPSVRPDSWPGGGLPVPPARPVSPLDGQGQPSYCESAQILARAGTDVILISDVVGGVDDMIARGKENSKDKIPAAELEAQRKQLTDEVNKGIQELLAHLNDPDPGSFVDPQRRAIIRQLLKQQIETKLVFQDARRKIPAEAIPNIEEQVGRHFDQTELKKLLKRENVTSRDELERRLKTKGTSIEREKKRFMEKVIYQQHIRDQIKVEDEITQEQMVTWYQGHLSEFEKPARARWEELMVRFSKYPSKAAAFQAIAQLGNQVALNGAPMAQVAKTQSDGPTATTGGARDWTYKGGLVSEQLDKALFGLPVGQLSPILESPGGYHIIRVTQREEISRTPFLSAQKEVREKIRDERTKKQYTDYVARIQREFPIWTIFDNPSGRPQLASPVERPRYQ